MLPPHNRGKVKWYVCFLAFLATLVIYSDRQFLALLKSTLAEEIHWTDTEFGTVNSSFLGAYAVGLLFFGRLIDRIGVKRGYALCMGLWSLAALSHTLVTTVSGFIAARIFLGLSEAGNFPAAVKVVAQWFPQNERAFATALFNSGANVGAIVAPPLVAWLLSHGSWRSPFIVAAVAGVAWIVFWFAFYGSWERQRTLSSAQLVPEEAEAEIAQGSAGRIPWFRLLAIPQAWSFIIAKFLTDPVWFFLLIWLPDYFKKTRGLDIKSSWPHLMTVYAIVTLLSLLGGYLPGYLARHGWKMSPARKVSLLGYALLVTPVLLVGHANIWTAVVLVGVVGAAHQAWSANLFTTLSDMFPRGYIGSLVGFGSTAGGIGSMLFIYLCGHLLDFYGPTRAEASYGLLFGYAASAYLIAFVIQHLLAPRFEPVPMIRPPTL